MCNADKSPTMTIEEVADYLQISSSTVYKLARHGVLPGRKVGNNWRFSRAGIEEWLVADRVWYSHATSNDTKD